MPPPRILVLYNEPVLKPDHPDYASESEVVETAATVVQFLTAAHYQVERLGMAGDPAVLLHALVDFKPDAVFNLFEGLADHGHTEAHVAGLLEWRGIPFTGSPYSALCLARQKHLTKYLIHGASLPTPRFLVVDGLPIPPCTLSWPVIVKPALEDASVGLDQGSVVKDQSRLEERLADLLSKYGPPTLVEEFIPGRELNVAVVETPEPRILAISEIVFTNKDPNAWPIVTYDAKWMEGSVDFENTPARYPAEVEPKLAACLETLAKSAFRLVGCRDYARVDFRVHPSGQPFILEVNPNPDYHPAAGFAQGLAASGLTHAQFTVTLVENALRRKKARRHGETCR